MTFPGLTFSTPGDRPHRHIEAFSWHPFEFARRQTTRRQMSLPLEPLSDSYRLHIDKSSAGVPLRAPGDRLHIERRAFLWDPSQGAPEDRLYIYKSSPGTHPRGQTTKDIKAFLMPLEHKHQEKDYKRANKSSPGARFSTPGDRLHKHSRTSLPLGLYVV